MEEKERYEIHIYDDVCVALYDNGVLDKSINDTYKLEELLNQQDNHIKELEEEIRQLKQSQKQLAVSELEKVENWCEEHEYSDDFDYVITYEYDEEDGSGNVDYLKDYIDNQIKSLKGEKK